MEKTSTGNVFADHMALLQAKMAARHSVGDPAEVVRRLEEIIEGGGEKATTARAVLPIVQRQHR